MRRGDRSRAIDDLQLLNNTFLFGPGHDFISSGIFTRVSRARLAGNLVSDSGPTLANVWRDGGGNSNFTESDTIATLSEPYTTTVSNALGSGATTRWGLYFKGLGCDLLSTGNVRCVGRQTTTLNAPGSSRPPTMR